mmetsp:Transcript_68432/g.113751  ORF Transcript_68432/g.113751 Transcript_68432/m.113751 type:complete len:211 (+) Transcript_68432:400-1032(+)
MVAAMSGETVKPETMGVIHIVVALAPRMNVVVRPNMIVVGHPMTVVVRLSTIAAAHPSTIAAAHLITTAAARPLHTAARPLHTAAHLHGTMTGVATIVGTTGGTTTGGTTTGGTTTSGTTAGDMIVDRTMGIAGMMTGVAVVQRSALHRHGRRRPKLLPLWMTANRSAFGMAFNGSTPTRGRSRHSMDLWGRQRARIVGCTSAICRLVQA